MDEQRIVLDSYNITGNNLKNVGNQYITNVGVHNGACFLFRIIVLLT